MKILPLSKVKNKGFSLSELSIALAIIAIMVGSAISVGVTQDETAKKTQTQLKLDRIEEALIGYVALYKRLPCPADGTLPISDTEFGVERIVGASGSPDPATCTGNFDYLETSIGVVPVTTLLLPNEFMFDGWGRRIMYAVDERYANNTATNANCNGTTSTSCMLFFDPGTSSYLSVIDATASGLEYTGQAAYILISYGPNGHGAYPKTGGSTRINAYGTSNPTPLGADELSNSHLNSSGVDTAFDNLFVSKSPVKVIGVEEFDDMLRFKTQPEIILSAGGTIYNKNCKLADDIINNPASNSCTNAKNEANCLAFANQVMDLCLK